MMNVSLTSSVAPGAIGSATSIRDMVVDVTGVKDAVVGDCGSVKGLELGCSGTITGEEISLMMTTIPETK
jgi:hypothetical protein